MGLLLAGLLFAIQSIAQLQSPTQFFGFAPGEQMVTTHRLYQYAEHAARRPHQSENDDLRTNVRETSSDYAGGEFGRKYEELGANSYRPPQEYWHDEWAAYSKHCGPALVWMSYNVHGNEATNWQPFLKYFMNC